MALRVTEEEYSRMRGFVATVRGLDAANARKGRSKYGNKKVEIHGRVFHSKAEAARYTELYTMQQCGLISDLVCQKDFLVAINGVHICKYIADFVYLDCGKLVVEDVKGVATPVYKLKKKLVEALYGVRIREVNKRA